MQDFKKLNPIPKLVRWCRSRNELLDEVDSLRLENEQLRLKVSNLQQAKVKLENSLEERRREKETLRANLNSQKKTAESKELIAEQLGNKIAELRDENDRLHRLKKKK